MKNKKIRKILLINPPVTRPKDFSAKVVRVSIFLPLGLAYIAAYLEKYGEYEIKILDGLIAGDNSEGVFINRGESIRYGLLDSQIIKKIEEFSPDCIGVACLFSAMEADAINVCRIVKEVDADILTVVGGAHAGAIAKDLLAQNEMIDFVIQGEAELTFTELISSLNKGYNLSLLDGIAFRKNGTVSFIPKVRYIDDLDSLPFPARHLFDIKKYFARAFAHGSAKRSPFTQIITSRGCPFRCSFCAIGNHWGKKQRMRSAENVLEEIGILIKKYHVKEIHFEDDNLTADKARAMEIFEGMIRKKFDIIWTVPSGMAVAGLDEELLLKMRDSGCYSVTLAIESGNQKIVTKLMNKPLDLKKVPNLVKIIRKLGMEAKGFFIIGYPDETKETIRETVDFAKNLELDWAYFSIASPLPNTKMYKTCIEKGYIKEGDFDPIRSFHKSIICTPEFDPVYLARIREEAIVDVNFRNNQNLLKYDIDKAIKSFKQVLFHYPHFDFANFYLGEAYFKKGQRDKCIEYYKKTLSINPQHREARKRLEELEARGHSTRWQY